MKHNQISDLSRISRENLENIFNVYKEDGGFYFYNLLQTVVFPSDLPESVFNKYVIRNQDTWPFISYKAYNNTNLWWLILLANDIIDATKIPKPGTTIRVPNAAIVREVLSQIERSA
jgi:nucleoid-associated protein YgaU